MQDSQRRLYGLELFQFANVEPQNTDQQPEEVPIKVTVAEGKHQRVNFGVGYGTEEKARADVEYHHLNFLGGARSAGVHARWSSLDRGLKFDFTQPYFFQPHLSLGTEAQRWYTFTPAYSSIVTGAKVTMTHRSSARTSWSVSATSEHETSSIAPDVLNDPTLRNSLIALGLDPTTDEQNVALTAAGFDFSHTTADNLLNAHHGYQIAFHAENAGRLLGASFNYFGLSGDARQHPPERDNVVWPASRLQFGNLRPAAATKTISRSASATFGGATSIRGWGRYEVSPRRRAAAATACSPSARSCTQLHGNPAACCPGRGQRGLSPGGSG